ncbi:hypothetical protein [uncultured Gammaproteobacteria bacterium]|nr:hypothetical protein [uncultured Gammaproteobacteria bacterium]CAC9630467.1 hypothetical protein [uncultured Gammaproteobacteria bacterium]CAC9648146.1 hypothetical protein [uncultured Gammaproteobacteria bacterium]CAC9648489.1 hypothetical protein [uncultured Gammaproteobacteria bacterium]CAC9989065.1 hypothetical protein [uncultured Gammaproteobacteria bacterium]
MVNIPFGRLIECCTYGLNSPKKLISIKATTGNYLIISQPLKTTQQIDL